jgi:hypothetical protein
MIISPLVSLMLRSTRRSGNQIAHGGGVNGNIVQGLNLDD